MGRKNDSQILCRLFQDVHEREIIAATLEIKATSQEHATPAIGCSATHEVAKEKSKKLARSYGQEETLLNL